MIPDSGGEGDGGILTNLFVFTHLLSAGPLPVQVGLKSSPAFALIAADPWTSTEPKDVPVQGFEAVVRAIGPELPAQSATRMVFAP